MSSLIVEVCRIEKLLPHANADRLELAQIKGWQCVVPRGKYAAGDLVTYVPPDAVLPDALAEKLGVAKYLSKGRVRCARLRGEPSFGLVFDVESDRAEGTDVAADYGITKFVPPMKLTSGDALPDDALFEAYTDVENLRNFPTAFADGEEVVATEKIHGTNCRVGLIHATDDAAPVFMAGSKSVRRSIPANPADSLYAFPLSLDPVRNLLADLARHARQVILFGEVYGKVQSLRYGQGGAVAYRAFDLLVDGQYADADQFASVCAVHGVLTTPTLYRGPFSVAAVRGVSDGPSTLPGADNIREGVVVRPVRERRDPKLGRLILKYVGDGYLFGTDISDAEER